MNITKEELEQIRKWAYDDNCITISRKIDIVLARPNPLALLEKWVRYESEREFKNYNHSQVVIAVCGMIDLIYSNPEAVENRGKEEGWYS